MNNRKYKNNILDSDPDFSLDLDLDSDSEDEISLEITDIKSGTHSTHVYTVPYHPMHNNHKRLICYSTINNLDCNYGSNCTYAHSIDEQVIDDDKKFIYRIILDEKMMDFFSITNPKTEEIYKSLLFMSNVCGSCLASKCTGGFNCRHGVCFACLKLCKNDLLTGECCNPQREIMVKSSITSKLEGDGFQICEKYFGCQNGHHTSNRNLMPYYKYIHQRESTKIRLCQSQSIDYLSDPVTDSMESIMKFINSSKNGDLDLGESGSSLDEEIDSFFRDDPGESCLGDLEESLEVGLE